MMAMTGGHGPLFAAMKTGVLELEEENSLITFKVGNQLELDKITESKSNLLKALRSRLKNKVVDLKVKRVKDQSYVQSAPYTNKEKYQHLAGKNPALHILKDKLDLDYDI